MFELKSEAREFVADDRAEAVAKACGFFGVEESALQIKELPVGEIYGLGSRAVIVAVPPNAAPGRGRGADERRPSRSEDRPVEEGSRPGRGRERGREDSSRREREPRRRSRESQPVREPEPAAETEDEQPREVAADSTGTVSGEVGPIGEFILGVVERMGLGPFEISESSEGDFVVYQLQGAAAEDLGSGDGRAVDAIQLLANQVAMIGSEDAPRVVVDAEGNAERREAFLTRIAERAARRATDTGRAVALDPMNARDRRSIHLALREAQDVATMSHGSGRYRQVVVVPEGSPEFEEAKQSSESAATRDSG